MDVCVEMYLTIGLLYFIQTLTCVQGQYTHVYLGCFYHGVPTGLPMLIYNGTNNSIEHCVTLCEQCDYRYAGLQESIYCYCGNSGHDVRGEVGEGNCTSKCSGNSSQICGGDYINSVYEVVKLNASTGSSTTSRFTELPTTTPTTITFAEGESKALSTGTYVGIAVGAVVVCAIIVLVVALVIRRRKIGRTSPSEPISKSFNSNSYSAQTIKPRAFSEALSISQNTEGSSPSHPAARKHQVTASGDVYALVNKVKPPQVAADDAEGVYSSPDEAEEDAVYVNNLNDSDVYYSTASAVCGNKQSAGSIDQSHQVYDIAEHVNDDLEMVDSEIYGL